MLELLLLEFRNWQRDWDIYNKHPDKATQPPTKKQFIYYLRQKYPELTMLDDISETTTI